MVVHYLPYYPFPNLLVYMVTSAWICHTKHLDLQDARKHQAYC